MEVSVAGEFVLTAKLVKFGFRHIEMRLEFLEQLSSLRFGEMGCRVCNGCGREKERCGRVI